MDNLLTDILENNLNVRETRSRSNKKGLTKKAISPTITQLKRTQKLLETIADQLESMPVDDKTAAKTTLAKIQIIINKCIQTI